MMPAISRSDTLILVVCSQCQTPLPTSAQRFYVDSRAPDAGLPFYDDPLCQSCLKQRFPLATLRDYESL